MRGAVEITDHLKAKLPRRVADKMLIAGYTDNGGTIVVFFKLHVSPAYVLTHKLVTFSYSDDFPTELDIARLCIECP